MKKLAIAFAATAIGAVGAIAQTTTTTPPPAPSTTAPAPNTAPRANQTQANAPAQAKEVTQILASDIIRSDVYDPQENKIGAIDDVLMSRGGQPEQAIIGVGGFLGMGEKDVAIPFSELKIKSRNGKNWFELARSKDQLKSAPGFDTKSHKMM